MTELSRCPHCRRVAVRHPFSFCPKCGNELAWPSEPDDDFGGGNCRCCGRGMHWSMEHCPWCGERGESVDWLTKTHWLRSVRTWFSRLRAERPNPRLLNVPYFSQSDGHTCAVRCIVMVAAYYHYEIGPDRARRFAGAQCDPNEDGGGHGLDTNQIVRAIRGIGLEVRRLRDRYATLKQLRNAIDNECPIIVSVQVNVPGDHAVVVVGYDDNHIYVNDPLVYRPQLIPADTFQDMWARDGLVVRGK